MIRCETYHFKRGQLLSTMDFADEFGANLEPIEAQMVDIIDQKEIANGNYIIQELEESSALVERVLADIDGLTQEAIYAKDRALFWTFLIEWLVVSGTCMFAGFLVWTLMVKRSLYKEAHVTKLIEH